MKVVGRFTIDLKGKNIATCESKGYEFDVRQESENILTVEIRKKGRW